MDFDNDYWNAMDKDAPLYQTSAKQLSMSTAPFRDQLAELKGKVFQGMSNVELGFMGRGKGSRSSGNIVPEMFGKNERQAMRELAKVNEIELTTHASANVIGFAGFGERAFREDLRENSLHEVERAIDFAADTAGGGPVVIHTGEFPRPLFEASEKLEGFPKEKEESPIYMVNKRDGSITAVPRKREIAVPVLKDEKGPDEASNYVRDEETGMVKFQIKTVGDLEKEKGGIKFYTDLLKKNLESAKGEAERWGHHAQEARKSLEYLQETKSDLEDQNKKNPQMARRNAIQKAEKIGGIAPKTIEEEKKFYENPFEFYNKAIKNVEREVNYYDEASRSKARELKEIESTYDDLGKNKMLVSMKDFAVEKSSDTIARAALNAYDVEKARGLSKPLFVAPENIFAEHYGSGLKELKNIIEGSREEMVRRLTDKDDKYKLSKEQAEKIAEDHIKATVDVGHANTLRKYFKGTDKEFNKWIVNEFEDLAKRKMIGHIHLSDNFGYEDEHVTPGMGNTPIKEFVEVLKKHGYGGKMVVEAGAQAEGQVHTAFTGTMGTLHSPIYRIDSGYGTWSDVEGSYFGRTGSPSYLVGEVVPSKDWTFWSETPLE